MALPVAAAAGIGAILLPLFWRAWGIASRQIGYKIIVEQIVPLYNEITLAWIIDKFVTDQEKKGKLLQLLTEENGLKPINDFIEFLKEWNKEITLKALSASIVSPEWGAMASRLLGSLQWSYGLGWLSWVGMSPILNHIVAEPADIALQATFPSKNLTKSEIEKAFREGIFDEAKLKAELRALGYTDEAITTIIALIHNAKTEKERDLTKADILRAYREGVMNRDQALEELDKLGYSQEEAEILLKLADMSKTAEKKVKKKDLTASQILQAYRYGVIEDRNEAKVLLLQIGYDEEEAELLLRIEDAKKHVEKHKRARDLTKTDILKAMVKGLISPEEAKKMLLEIGYDEDEAELLVALKIMEVVEHAQQAGSPESSG